MAAWEHELKKTRRSFEAGHFRKFLLIVDESKEVESALYFAASRIQRSSGSIVMLYVIVPQEFQHWINVRQQQVEEETTKAKALFRLFRRKLNLAGFRGRGLRGDHPRGGKGRGDPPPHRRGRRYRAPGARGLHDPDGPGPLVSSFAAGTTAGDFPIPMTVVPGQLALADIQALA